LICKTLLDVNLSDWEQQVVSIQYLRNEAISESWFERHRFPAITKALGNLMAMNKSFAREIAFSILLENRNGKS